MSDYEFRFFDVLSQLDTANSEIESLLAELAAEREKVILKDHHYSVMKVSAEVLAARVDAQSQQLAALTLSEQRLRAAMQASRDTLDRANDDEDGPIGDTIWHRPSETLFDFMDAALSTPTDTAALEAYVSEKVEPWKKRVDFMVFYGARVCHANDAEFCWVEWPDGSDLRTTQYFATGVSAIDAAIAAQEPKA